ncbi:hypothetical protein [Roseomonas sp. BN140053]|uniref:hypothetical protein n=1 Tax=Roseomonas sp. BN140053 TaxID=3391898 RepID=UPI0039EA5025
MKLDEILALHPVGANAATLRTAIAQAEATRSDLLARAAELDRTRERGLLTQEEKAILKAEADAASARLAANRIVALLPRMQADLHGATGRETLAVLRAEAAEVMAVLNEEGMSELFLSLRATFRANVAAAYLRQDVRDAGPLGIEEPADFARDFAPWARSAVVNAAKSYLFTAIVEPHQEGVVVSVDQLRAVIIEPHPSGLTNIPPLLLEGRGTLRLPLSEAEALYQRGYVTSPTTGEEKRDAPDVAPQAGVTISYGTGPRRSLESTSVLSVRDYLEPEREALAKYDAKLEAEKAKEERRGGVGDREGRLPVRVQGVEPPAYSAW